MALSDWIGTIGWKTEVDTSGVEADLERGEAKVRETLEKIDRMEGKAEVGLDLKELEADAAKARAIIAALNREKIEIEASLEKLGDYDKLSKGQKAYYTRLKNDLKAANDQLKIYGQHQREIANDRSLLVAIQKRSAAVQKAARIEEQAAKRAMDDLHAKALAEDRYRKRAMDRIHSLARAEDRYRDKQIADARKAQAAHEKELALLPRMRVQYAQMAAARNKLNDKSKWARTVEDNARLPMISAEMDSLGARIRALGGDFEDLDRNVDDDKARLLRWASSIGSIRVQVGFLSGTLRQATIALGTMGPMIVNLVGAAGALVGVIGGGLIGAVGAGAAGLTAMGLATFGLWQAFKPLSEDMGAATAAATAYDDAVRKYGKSSDQAKTAQENLRTTMKNIEPAARKAVNAFADMRDEYIELTAPARTNMLKLMGDGIKRLGDLTPAFARSINDLSGNLEQAGDNFLDAFNAKEMRSTMQELLGNFSKALPALGTAIGNIAEGLSNIFAEFSTHFDDISNGLLDWSEGFVKGTQDAEGLSGTIDTLMDSAATLVDFLGSAGDLIATFFGLGQEAGGNLMDDMTAQMDEWTAAMEADSSGVKQFFEDSVEGTKDLWAVLKPLGDTFLDVATALQPFTSGLLAVAEALADVVSAFADLNIGGMNIGGGLLTALGGIMGGKLLFNAAKGVPLLGAGLTMLQTRTAAYGRSLGTTVPLVSRMGKESLKLPPVIQRGGAAAQQATSRMGTLAKGASTLGSTFARGAAAVTGLLGPVGMIATAGLLAADAFGVFSDSSAEVDEYQRQLIDTMAQGNQALRGNAANVLGIRTAMLGLPAAFKQGGDAATAAFNDIRASIKTARAPLVDQQRQIKDWQQGWEEGGAQVQSFFETLTESMGHDKFVDVMEDLDPSDFNDIFDSIARTGKITAETRGELERLGLTATDIDALSETFGDMSDNMARTTRQTAALDKALINATRGAQGMSQLDIGTGAIERMQRQVGRKQTMEILMKVDDTQAANKIMRLTNQLTKMGGRQTVMRILADTNSPEQALRRLEDLKRQASRPFSIIARDAVSNVAAGARNAIEAIPDSHNTNIGADGSAAIGAAQSVVATINSMVATIQVRAVGGGLSAGARAEGGQMTPRPGEIPGYASGGGYITKPIFMVGEEAPRHPEYVIATNPAYRKQNLNYWMQAAQHLGIPGFAKGKGNDKGGKGKKGYKAPHDYRVGGIPEDRAQGQYSAAQSAYQNAKQRVDDMESRMKYHKGPDRGLKDDLKRLREKQANMREKMKEAKKNLDAVQRANKHINAEQAEIDNATSMMTLGEQNGNMAMFNKGKKSKIENINQLIDLLTRARSGASGQFATEIDTRILDLRTELGLTNEETPVSGSILSPTQQAMLEQIESRVSLARLTDPTTDDTAAGGELVRFWEKVLRDAQASGAPATTITQAADELYSAKQALEGISGAGSGTAGQQFTSAMFNFDKQRTDLYKSFGSNIIAGSTSMLSTAQGFTQAPPPLSGTPYPGGGSTTNKNLQITNNYTAPPPDPMTWSRALEFEAGVI